MPDVFSARYRAGATNTASLQSWPANWQRVIVTCLSIIAICVGTRAQLLQANTESFFVAGSVAVTRADGSTLFRLLSHNLTNPRWSSTSSEALMIVEQLEPTCTLLATASPIANQRIHEVSFYTMLLFPGDPRLRIWSHSFCQRAAMCYTYVACSSWVNTMQAYANVLETESLNQTIAPPKPKPCPECVNCTQWLLELTSGNSTSAVFEWYVRFQEQYSTLLTQLLHFQKQTVLDHPLIGLAWSLTLTLLLSLLFTGNWFGGNDDETDELAQQGQLDSYQLALRHSATGSGKALKNADVDDMSSGCTWQRVSRNCCCFGCSSTTTGGRRRKRCGGLCHPVISVLTLLLFVERLASTLLTIELFMMWTLIGLSSLVWLPIYSLLIRNNPRLVYCCCFCCCWDKLHSEHLWPPTRNNCKELFTLPIRGLRNLPLVLLVVLDVGLAIAYLYALRESVVLPVYTS